MNDSILIFQEETNTHKPYIQYMTDCGYSVKSMTFENEPYSVIPTTCPNIILIDVKEENEKFIDHITEIRRWCCLPVILIIQNASDYFIAKALDSGADDVVVTAPVSSIELLARIRTAMRHVSQQSNNAVAQLGIYKCGELVIDYDKHKVTVNKKEVHLTLNEYKILTLMGKYPGKILTYEYIINQVWGDDSKTDNLILRVNISNLRRKIESYPNSPRYIFTQVGIGYKLAEEETMAV